MKTTENKDAYSTPDYERMTFETSDLIQQSGKGGIPVYDPGDDNEGVNLFRS